MIMKAEVGPRNTVETRQGVPFLEIEFACFASGQDKEACLFPHVQYCYKVPLHRGAEIYWNFSGFLAEFFRKSIGYPIIGFSHAIGKAIKFDRVSRYYRKSNQILRYSK